MTKPDRMPRLHELRALEDTLREHRCDVPQRPALAGAAACGGGCGGSARRPQVRKLAIGVGAAFAVVSCSDAAGCGCGLRPARSNSISCRPGSLPRSSRISGSDHKVAIAGTQIERDDAGRTAIRILDMQVRDTDGAVVASAPKAEVSVSGASLLRGQVRARRVSLVGAELSVRIEEDGQVTISTGGEKRPLAVTPAIVRAAPAVAGRSARPAGNRRRRRNAMRPQPQRSPQTRAAPIVSCA